MLERQKLENEIRKLNDESYSGFGEFPTTCISAAAAWSNAYFIYAEKILPESKTVSLAKEEARLILLGICGSKEFNQSVEIFEQSIKKFAMSIIPGMLPTFSGIMPTKILNMRPIFLKTLDGGTAEQFAIDFSNEVDTWFKSGTAINVNSSATINWK